MPSLAATTIYLFGLSALIAGLSTIYDPVNSAFGPQPEQCANVVQASGLAATAVGLFYLLAASQENTKFFVLTLVTRALTTYVFWSNGGMWRKAALWEGGGAALTGLAMVLKQWRRSG